MSRRGENIFKRKDGRWEARYIHHYEDGKAKYRYLYAKTYAEVKLKQTSAMASLNICKEPTEKQLVNLEELSTFWLADVRLSVKESTYTRYYRTVTKYIVPALGKIQITKIDSRVINRYAEELLNSGGVAGKPLSSKTVTDILCVMKSINKFGRINGYPCTELAGVRYPQKTAKTTKIFNKLSRTTLETILFHSDDTTSLGIIFSIFMGLRIGEVCGLMWGDIDFENSTVKILRTVERIADLDSTTTAKTKVIISEPKTESSIRTIPIPNFLTEHLYRQKKEDDTFLLTESAYFIEPHSFYMRYKRFLNKHNIDDYTYHALRHTFATRCVEAGFDIKSLAEILGHASVTTTMNFYVHPSIETKRSQMEKLAPSYHS